MTPIVYILGFRNTNRVKKLMTSLEGFTVLVIDNDPQNPLDIEGTIPGPGGGFTPGFNCGLRHFMSTYGDGYVPIILNDDLEVEPGCIEAMVQEIENGAGIVAPMQVQMDNPSIVICGGFGAAYPSGQHKGGMRGDPGIKREVSRWVTFCAVAITPNVVRDIGYLDEWMTMYYSDSDYCFRATELGWQCIFTPAGIVRHENHGASSEYLKQQRATRCLIMDKWHFDNKWSDRVKTHLS
jgi:N-acetylglucosaminyl-diphospho-decaprenol L-rhamnosyltransferase